MDTSSQYQPFTSEHNDIYEELRKTLIKLHFKGLPGADKMLQAMNKIHTDQIGQAGMMTQKGADKPEMMGQGMSQGMEQG